MRKLVLVVAVCGLAAACGGKDTASSAKWRRPFEPRLSVSDAWTPCLKRLPKGRVVETAQCGSVVLEPVHCNDPVDTPAEALTMLASRCTDAAIAGLKLFAKDRAVRSDLAAAYYIRAQADDQPVDLLRALDALELDAPSPAAQFNLALIQTTLGLTSDAIASWNAYLAIDASSPWAGEARTHRDRLVRERDFDAATRWALARRKLETARDPAAVAQFIAPFPASTEQYVEEELLPQGRIETATLIARAWGERTGDRFLEDTVRAFATTPDPQALRDGHRAYAEARAAERAFDIPLAATRYARAAELLARARSPFRLQPELRHAIRTAQLDRLGAIERTARENGYTYLLARVHATRGFFLQVDGRYMESVAAYEAAAAIYAGVRDLENVAISRGRKSSAYAYGGEHTLAWREAFQALRYASHVVDTQERHALLGEATDAADALGFARAGLAYQTMAVDLLRQELAALPPNALDRIARMQTNLAIAYRRRAGLYGRLDRDAEASRDVDEALRLVGRQDERTRKDVGSRIEEVRGQILKERNPSSAVAAFTRALTLARPDDDPTFRARLLSERAESLRKMHKRRDAEHDLVAALAVLRTEEQQNLARRERGSSDDFWSPYFSRFRDAYDALIRHLMEEKRYAEAFDYAEKLRAYEPLDLLLRSRSVPAAFRALTAEGRTIRAIEIQRLLADDTVLLEYAVLEDRTYTWILSRNLGIVMTQRASRTDVERWSAALQHAARVRDAAAFEGALYAPYAELIARPLAVIRQIQRGQPRVVIVPDGAMHGLPFPALHAKGEPYLVEMATPSTAPSATLYVFSTMQDAQLSDAGRDVLLVGDPAFDERATEGLTRLPYAQREMERIRHLYGSSATVLSGEKATVDGFLDRARHNAIVHVAAHAIVNARAPSQSSLLLAGGTLNAHDLLTALELDRTRLFVLSTCSSAGGLPVGPEGVAPLVRPLLTAGVPGVIGSLWDVDDATTAELFVSFHRHYSEGRDAAKALQLAQTEMLNSDQRGLRPALAWASFQVIGHASSPFARARKTEKEKEKPP